MKERKIQVKNTQIILRHSTPVLKILVIVLVLFSTTALIALTWVQSSLADQTEQIRQQAVALEQQNQILVEKTEDLGSVQSIEEIAREELGLVHPDTILIQPE